MIMAPFIAWGLGLLSTATPASAYCYPRSSSTPALPLNEIAANDTGSAGLPAPTGNPTAIVLGIGYQNYTCNATSNSSGSYIQTGPSDGALAELFDITHVLTTSNIDTVSPDALVEFEKCSASTSDYVACHHAAILAVTRRPNHVGQHFFSPSTNGGAQTPHFALDEYSLYLAAKRSGSAPAPAGAYKGANGLGAVAWLYLINDGEAYTCGLTSVYRVETAGGAAPGTCSGAQAGTLLSVPYVAQYWFYD